MNISDLHGLYGWRISPIWKKLYNASKRKKSYPESISSIDYNRPTKVVNSRRDANIKFVQEGKIIKKIKIYKYHT